MLALEYLGYINAEDFVYRQAGGAPIELVWLSDKPQPTTAEIAAAELPAKRASMQCTPIQGELAMIRYGEQISVDLIGAYDAYRASPERTREEKAWIERTQIWKRLDPNVLTGAAAVGITDDALLDQLFELAKTL